MAKYFQLYHKSKDIHLKAGRYAQKRKEYIGIVIADCKYPPFILNSGIGMFKTWIPNGPLKDDGTIL